MTGVVQVVTETTENGDVFAGVAFAIIVILVIGVAIYAAIWGIKDCVKILHERGKFYRDWDDERRGIKKPWPTLEEQYDRFYGTDDPDELLERIRKEREQR
jgi:hypothetical protein